MRRLAPEERALWEKVIASVRPLQLRNHKPAPMGPPLPEASAEATSTSTIQPAPAPKRTPAKRPRPGTTLDAGWDRRLAQGAVQPDVTVDLHGHNLATAYDLLDRRLEQAVASGARLVLLITGKPPSGEKWPVERGAIRAAVGDWLAASRHAGDIAAIRAAHRRHGGAGALYIVIRRRR